MLLLSINTCTDQTYVQNHFDENVKNENFIFIFEFKFELVASENENTFA